MGIEAVGKETVFFNVGYIGVEEMEIDLFALQGLIEEVMIESYWIDNQMKDYLALEQAVNSQKNCSLYYLDNC